MSREARGLRKFLLLVRRPCDAVAIFAALGLLAGVGLALDHQPMLTSQAFVVVALRPSAQAAAPPAGSAGINPSLATEIVIAGSEPVSQSALRAIHPSMSLQTLQSRVQVTKVASDVLSVSAEGKTAAQAQDTANAVANSFVAFVDSQNSPVPPFQANLLDLATTATGPSLSSRMPLTGCLGALLGALIGAIGAMVFGRGGRRLPM